MVLSISTGNTDGPTSLLSFFCSLVKMSKDTFSNNLKKEIYLFIILFSNLLHTDSSLHQTYSGTVSGIHQSLFLDPFLDYQMKLNLYNTWKVKCNYLYLLLFGLQPPVIGLPTLPVGSCRKQAFQNSSQPLPSISNFGYSGLSSLCCSLLRNTFGRVLKANHIKSN